MTTTRRDFIERMTMGAAAFGALPVTAETIAGRFAIGSAPAIPAAEWDQSWFGRIKGKHKAIFDVPEIESGYGVWRASIWVKQYGEVLGTKVADMTPVLVLRHNAIVLAMQQAYWDKYGVGAANKVTHPVTLEPTDRNPVLLSSSRNEIPATFDAFALDQFIARKNIVLACNLAFQDVVDTVKAKDGVSDDEARKRALSMLVPGVIMQPSGVFAALRAQEAGCTYLRAS